MDAGKEIMPHHGPYDGLLRYQLALDIPDQGNELGECYLHVGGERYYWTEGKGIMFDEANLHGAVNTTAKSRMVLLIDLERPYQWSPFRWLNKGIIWSMGALPATHAAIQ
jgi:beta-hydroxylase